MEPLKNSPQKEFLSLLLGEYAGAYKVAVNESLSSHAHPVYTHVFTPAGFTLADVARIFSEPTPQIKVTYKRHKKGRKIHPGNAAYFSHLSSQ